MLRFIAEVFREHLEGSVEDCIVFASRYIIDSTMFRQIFLGDIKYPRLVQPLIYRVLQWSFLTVIRRSFLTSRGHIDSPRRQSVRRRTSRSHRGYQRFPIPQVQVAPIVRKAYLTIVLQFIHSNQSSRVHLSLRSSR